MTDPESISSGRSLPQWMRLRPDVKYVFFFIYLYVNFKFGSNIYRASKLNRCTFANLSICLRLFFFFVRLSFVDVNIQSLALLYQQVLVLKDIYIKFK